MGLVTERRKKSSSPAGHKVRAAEKGSVMGVACAKSSFGSYLSGSHDAPAGVG